MHRTRIIVYLFVFTVFLFSVCSSAAVNPEETAETEQNSPENKCGKLVALTFDDGPDNKYTPEILDILKEYNIPATFFVLGVNAEKYPELVRRELNEGHEVANHTYSHKDLSTLSENEITNEILKLEDVLYRIVEYRPQLLRPPGGAYNSNVDRIARRLEYDLVLWDIDTRDWKHPPAEEIADAVLRNIKPDSIILCHDYVVGGSNTAAAMRIFIPKLLEEGYKFVRVSELLDCI